MLPSGVGSLCGFVRIPCIKTWLKESLKRIQPTGNRFRAPSSSILVSSIPTQLPPCEVGLYIVLTADSYIFPVQQGGNSKTKDIVLIVEGVIRRQNISRIAMEVFVANNVENLINILELVPKVVSFSSSLWHFLHWFWCGDHVVGFKLYPSKMTPDDEI